MKFDEKVPPREFKVGVKQDIVLKDMGEICLEPNEQVTFKTDDGKEYDFVKKEWGFYASPSLNSRLKRFNLRSVLIKNRETNNYFFLVVEKGKEEAFYDYLEEENLILVTWMDEDEVLQSLDKKLNSN